MRTKLFLMCLSVFFLTTQNYFAQSLPTKIKGYLNKNYNGWILTKDKCGDTDSKAFVIGNFNDDRRPDYAVKFAHGKKGYIIAFLAQNKNYHPFVLHNDLSAEDANYLSLDIWKKGETFEYEGKSFRLRHDAPSDYRCESDVGGIHYYRNGKFVGY